MDLKREKFIEHKLILAGILAVISFAAILAELRQEWLIALLLLCSAGLSLYVILTSCFKDGGEWVCGNGL